MCIQISDKFCQVRIRADGRVTQRFMLASYFLARRSLFSVHISPFKNITKSPGILILLIYNLANLDYTRSSIGTTILLNYQMM